MPRDPRPYVTYPLNYTGHPRIESMSDGAFRAFHEMNDYSRVHGLDGLIPEAVARKKWSQKVLAEMVTGIDDRPLVELTDRGFFIRSYAEHQFTTADMDALREKRANAGAAGGKAKAAAKQAASKGVASASPRGKQNVAESESESESELLTSDVTNYSLSGPVSNARAKETDEPLESLRTKALIEAERLRIADLADVRQWLEKASGRVLDLGEAVELAGSIIGRAKGEVDSGDRYVIGTCRKSPARVAAYADDLDLGEVAA